MTEEVLLLYCITEEYNPSLNAIKGFDGKPLNLIEYQGLYGIYSKTDLEQYSENQMQINNDDIKWIAAKATEFMRIILAINEQLVLIPMKFLTIFKDEERLREVIAENSERFKEQFNTIRGGKEFSVKIYCNDQLFKETAMKTEITEFEKGLAGKPKGAAFFLKKKFDLELDTLIQKKVNEKVTEIINYIKIFSKQMKINQLLAKEITGVKERMAVNCACLINNNKISEFLNYMENIFKENINSGLDIECSGPWPPFSFCL